METHEVKELLSQFDQSTLTELQLKKETFELYFNKNTTSGLQNASSAPAANAAPTPVAPTPAVSATPWLKSWLKANKSLNSINHYSV